MLTFFAITVMLDLHTATDLVMNMIKELLEIFPASVHLKAQRALVYYHMRGKLLVHIMRKSLMKVGRQISRRRRRSLTLSSELIHTAWRKSTSTPTCYT